MTSGDDRASAAFAYHLGQGTWPLADAYVARLELDATAGAGAATCRALEPHLLGWVQEDELELLKTLACELVVNAVVHPGHGSSARVGLLIGASPRCLRVDVRDEGPGSNVQAPPPRTATAAALDSSSLTGSPPAGASPATRAAASGSNSTADGRRPTDSRPVVPEGRAARGMARAHAGAAVSLLPRA